MVSLPIAIAQRLYRRRRLMCSFFVAFFMTGAALWRDRDNDVDTTILMWTDLWYEQINGYRPSNCVHPIQPERHRGQWCRVTRDRWRMHDAGLLVFHARDVNPLDLPPRRIRGQPWVYLTQESWAMELSLNPGVVRNDTIMALFDLSANYHMDADIPHPYSFGLAAQNELREENLRKPLDDLETKRSLRRGQSPVVWIASNCHAINARQNYIAELMKHIPIDSYGACLQTAKIPEFSVRDVLRPYKFYLAFENSNCPQYVTEKFFNALHTGVLPIVDGPPEGYHGFAPDNHSLIRIDDFPDPRDLASFLRKLDNDDDAYKSYFRYKRAGPTHETMVGDAAKKDLFTGPILPPGDIDPVFRERWFNRTANFDRDWCGICRRSALAMHERQRLKEYKATEKSFFKRWFYADQSTDPFINRSSRTPKRIRVGYEQCLPGGKYLYLAVNSSVPEAGLELAQREWWNGFRASKDGGIVSMRKRPGFENSYVS